MMAQEAFFATKVVPAASLVEQWRPSLVGLLNTLKNATSSEWEDETFLRELWASEAVSATGQGRVPIDIALADTSFRQMFGSRAQQARQLAGQEQVVALKSLLDVLYATFKELGLPRMPRLKVSRVLAALAPSMLTTLANPGTRIRMYRWVTGKSDKGVHAIDQQIEIRRAFDEFAKPYPQLADPENLTTFMLPWIAFDELEKSRKAEQSAASKTRVEVTGSGAAAVVVPTKTFISVGGGLPRLLEICDMVGSAPLSDEDFYESLQERYPWNYPWAKSVAQFLTNSIGILSREDAAYFLSPLGQELLEKKSGNVLGERLVRNFVGVDHVLTALRDGAKSKVEMVALLRQINPRAQTDFLPNTTLNWMVALDVAALSKGEYSLTPTGFEWTNLVKWTPSGAAACVDIVPEAAETTPVEMDVPAWRLVKAQFASAALLDGMKFPERKLFEVHAGLWSHPVRHFCVLKGLSGAGKTQMAVRYAKAVIEAAGEDESCLEIIPVQPDWSEPSHLLGFTHPLDSTKYQSTQFLKILLRAHENPTKPHFAILDEMNLAHPELYLAPILSAMETESELWLHQATNMPGHGIPGSIRYPRNLAIIGTINIDETTHNLSDKVKDRAEIVDFSEVNLEEFDWSRYTNLGERLGVMRNVLTLLHDALLPVRLHFGFRVVSAIVGRVAFAIEQLEDEATDGWLSLFDEAVASKVLPKLRGEESKDLRLAMDSTWAILDDAKLRKCALQVDVLRQELARDGVLKYWR